jgi:hypothetical protein
VLAAASSAIAQQVSSDAQVGFEQRPQLSPQDELAQANVALTRMDQAASMVRRGLATARAARDVIKTLCLNDKLSQIDVAVRSARDRQSSLQAAVQRHDTELANHEFSILVVLRQRTEQLNAEANQCIGEEVAFVGQTQVTTTVDTILPSDEWGFLPFPQPVIPAPPIPVSATF